MWDSWKRTADAGGGFVRTVGATFRLDLRREMSLKATLVLWLRSSAHAFAGGVRTFRRFPMVAALTVVVVSVSVFVGLLAIAVSPLAATASDEMVRATTVVAVLDEPVPENFTKRLGELSGVGGQRPAEFSDLTEVAEWYGASPTASDPAVVLELDGTRSADEILGVLRNTSGVQRAAVSIGDEFYLVEEFLAAIVPWVAALLLLGAVAMVVNLARMVVAAHTKEASVMRLIGAGRASIWMGVGAPTCALVLAAGVLAAASFLGSYWVAADTWLSPRAAATLAVGDVVVSSLGLVGAMVASAVLVSWFQLRRAFSV